MQSSFLFFLNRETLFCPEDSSVHCNIPDPDFGVCNFLSTGSAIEIPVLATLNMKFDNCKNANERLAFHHAFKSFKLRAQALVPLAPCGFRERRDSVMLCFSRL